MKINALNFVDNLYYMGVGMLSIFIVIGVIILITMFIGRLSAKSKGKAQKEVNE